MKVLKDERTHCDFIHITILVRSIKLQLGVVDVG